ncbi:hypothetical protein CR513_44607, partial [Mucuna pruriens]
MEDHDNINQMFGRFQKIINNLRFLGKTYDNYNHIIKILQNLKKLPMEEILGTLKVHEIELNEDEGRRKGKSIALKAQKAPKRSSSKAFKVEESCEEAYDMKKKNLIKTSSLLFQGRSTLYGKPKEDLDERTTLEGTQRS